MKTHNEEQPHQWQKRAQMCEANVPKAAVFFLQNLSQLSTNSDTSTIAVEDTVLKLALGRGTSGTNGMQRDSSSQSIDVPDVSDDGHKSERFWKIGDAR